MKMEEIPLSVLYIRVHSENTCQWTEWNPVFNRKTHQRPGVKTQVYQPKIKHDKNMGNHPSGKCTTSEDSRKQSHWF